MAKSKYLYKNMKLGSGAKIDPGVFLGYLPSRKIDIVSARIGRRATIRSNAVIYTNVNIGDNLETGHNVIIREENNIGNNFRIWNNSVVDYGCKIGNNVKIHNNTYIAQYTIIGDDVFIAPGVTLANDLCPTCCKCMKGPTIKKGARIGVNSTILPHIVIGENCLIGAGSVVTKNIPRDSVAFGNPAKVKGTIYDIQCKFGIADKPYKHKDG